jgi:hypothetical protein
MINKLTPEEIKTRKQFEKNKKKLICDFDKDAVLEVKLDSGRWARVTYMGFRCWEGERRVDGKPYEGPVYLYGTNKLKKK